MSSICIKEVSPDDIDQLQQIGRQTFFETFSSANTAENMSKYLEDGFSKARLSAELQDPGTAFYFALVDEQVAGYLKLNFGKSQTDLKEDKGVEIERIYVLKEWQGKEVGQMLYEKAIELAEQAGAEYVWLGVWEENPRAIRFYQKNGFVVFDKHIFRLGDDEQTDLMMKVVLKNKS